MPALRDLLQGMPYLDNYGNGGLIKLSAFSKSHIFNRQRAGS